jgi:uncharacterized membrane protein
MTDDTTPRGRRHIGIDRLGAFSDGVFAIAITILVLEITVPEDEPESLLHGVLGLWPSYLAYAVSFSTIGVTWLAHTAITDRLAHADALLARLNLLLLLFVSFLPFPTSLVAENVGDVDDERVAVTIYGVNLLVVALLLRALWRYAADSGHLRPAPGDDITLLIRRLRPAFASYVGLLVLGLFLPTIAVSGYLGVALYRLIPFGLRRAGEQPSGG